MEQSCSSLFFSLNSSQFENRRKSFLYEECRPIADGIDMLGKRRFLHRCWYEERKLVSLQSADQTNICRVHDQEQQQSLSLTVNRRPTIDRLFSFKDLIDNVDQMVAAQRSSGDNIDRWFTVIVELAAEGIDCFVAFSQGSIDRSFFLAAEWRFSSQFRNGRIIVLLWCRQAEVRRTPTIDSTLCARFCFQGICRRSAFTHHWPASIFIRTGFSFLWVPWDRTRRSTT